MRSNHSRAPDCHMCVRACEWCEWELLQGAGRGAGCGTEKTMEREGGATWFCRKKSVGVHLVLPEPHKKSSSNSDSPGCFWGGEGRSAH